MSSHAISDNDQGELVVFIQVRPCEVLHQKTVLVPAALAPDGSDAGDVKTQRSGRLRDRFRAGRLAG